MFARLGMVFGEGPTVVEQAGVGAEVLVVGDPPVGFALVGEVDGLPFLEQISVRASRTGQGLGARLLEAALDVAGPDLTLITFRDVPWNAPWYGRHGFRPLPETEWGSELRSRWQTERDEGLHTFGPRVVMRHTPPG
ncbi:GNAT family N-acetyltransferase [Actinocorallia sp. API 0066]|uniref:GNAT family N-acetyltransferase n=1 Tax=Actinocorallia sp. API 0066 TaxID=2896846 RepID=UPI001E521C12|nr:GNAT family N-acetyltransferase [Actinocorallia sp. API 0066]MCD0453489.1 GNAT family N-acetyltransferase [Actinocorallia sp. API 0066]